MTAATATAETAGTGEMRWRLLRLIPVLTAAGPDVTRSAWAAWPGRSR